MARLPWTITILAFLSRNSLVSGLLHRLHSSVSIASLIQCRDQVESGEIFVESSDSASDLSLEQRNLRFGGVGRLYTNPAGKDPEDESHLEIVKRLTSATVVVVGLGGVGSWAAEALCRSGIGNLVLIDLDDICISNTNRQLHALSSSVGKFKIDAMKDRLLDINPDCQISLIYDFVSPDNVCDILSGIPNVSACLDAIDGSRGKSGLIAACAKLQIPIVTCGGSAGKTDPTKFTYADLTKADGDRLLSTCKKNLRKFYGFEQGVAFHETRRKVSKPPRKWNIMAVFSSEPTKVIPNQTSGSSLRRCDGALGTACFVTGTAGFVAAGQIVDMIAHNKLVTPRGFKEDKMPL